MDTQRAFVARHPCGAQVAAIVSVTAVLTYATGVLNFRSGWNIIWMLLLPITLGFILNRELGRQTFMAMALTGVAFLTIMVTGWAINVY